MAENETDFNLLNAWLAVKGYAKQISLLVVVSVVIAAIILLFLPRYYKSTAVLVAANPLLADKASIYNQQVDQLYSTYGTGDDLDRLYGIALLDTTYYKLVDSFKLEVYYNSTSKPAAVSRRNAMLQLKKDIELQRNELNQLTITAWHKNAQTAAAICNAMIFFVHATARENWMLTNQRSLQALSTANKQLQLEYAGLVNSSLQAGNSEGTDQLMQAQAASLLEQLKQNKTAAAQLQVAMRNNTPALIVQQFATPQPLPDRPRTLLILLGALFCSLAFGVVAALVIDRKHSSNV